MPRRAAYDRPYPPRPTDARAWAGWYSDPWGLSPYYPLGGWAWPSAAYVPVGYGRLPYDYGYDYTPRRRAEESPTYGRGGDEAARRWAQRYGYDIEYSMPPQYRSGGRSHAYDRHSRRRF